MGTLLIHGSSGQDVEKATELLGTAFFESGFDVITFIKKLPYSDIFGYVKYEKQQVFSKDVSSIDFFILLDQNMGVIKDAAKNAVVVLNSPSTKHAALKKYKTKNFCVDGAQISAGLPSYLPVLGGFVKACDAVSMKSMRKAIEALLGREKRFFDAVDAGYGALKR